MHFALPPRKPSHAPPYPVRSSRSSLSSQLRQRPVQVTAIVAVSFFLFYLVLSAVFPGSGDGYVEAPIPAGVPKVVIVTVFDETSMSKEYIGKIKANREDYAQRHGYANFFTNATTYTPYLGTAPSSWSLIPAVRHALTLHPQTPWFFSLSPHSLIMNPSVSLHTHILGPSTLSTIMLRDIPIVPPDSVIHTFSHLSPSKVDLILTQDAENLSPSSFLLRRGDWANFFLDSWMDTLYRTYNFQKAEGHALEHLTQWHPTILSHLALLPQRYLNAYDFEAALMGQASSTTDPSAPAPEIKQSVINENGPSLYSEGDFLVRFQGCDTQGGAGTQVGPGGVVSGKDGGKGGTRSCEKELEGYWGRWKKEVARIDGELGKGA